MVVQLIASFDVMQDLQCLLGVSRFDEDFLEAAFQGTVFLDGVTVLVECRGADTLDGAPCQCGFQDVCGIHGARCRTRSDEGVYLIDEDNHVRVLFQFLDQLSDTLLKLSSVFRAGDDPSQVECHQSFAEEHGRALPAGDHLCETLHDGTLAHAGLTDEDGVVLLPPAQDLHHALYLPLTTYHGVELVVQRLLCQVCREIVEHGCLRLRLFGLCRGMAVGCRRALAVRGLFLFLLIVLVGQSDTVLDAQQRQCILVIHIIHFQYYFSSVVHLVVQDGEQQVLLVHTGGALDTCLQHRQFQDIAGFLVKYQFIGIDRHADLILPHA